MRCRLDYTSTVTERTMCFFLLPVNISTIRGFTSRYHLFFFSSRRRHTRCGRDWSSDVCSSDLVHRERVLEHGPRRAQEALIVVDHEHGHGLGHRYPLPPTGRRTVKQLPTPGADSKIGRASCRERV